MSAVLCPVSPARRVLWSERFTLLFRKKSTWSKEELLRLGANLLAMLAHHPYFPEYVILYGHFTYEGVLHALKGGESFQIKEVLGRDSPALPFPPSPPF